jgi:hypothetical protein
MKHSLSSWCGRQSTETTSVFPFLSTFPYMWRHQPARAYAPPPRAALTVSTSSFWYNGILLLFYLQCRSNIKPEDGFSMLVRNVDNHHQDYMVAQRRRPNLNCHCREYHTWRSVNRPSSFPPGKCLQHRILPSTSFPIHLPNNLVQAVTHLASIR